MLKLKKHMLLKLKQKIIPLAFLIGIILFLFLNTTSVSAIKAEVTWPKIPGIDKQIIKGQDITLTLPELVKYLFNFAIMIGGLAAFFMLVLGGFRYLTSAGNPAAQTEAKDTITSALLGLILLLASYLLLQLINPDILILKPPTL